MKRNMENAGRFTIRLARDEDRDAIYRLRHAVYAGELGQHEVRPGGILRDDLDEFNTYLLAEFQGETAGFISVTPPGREPYSVDKYLARDEFPALFDESLYEVRLLTVVKPHRGLAAACLLMYAAFRYVDSLGGQRIIGIGRREIMGLYCKLGMEPLGRTIRSGAVTYELMTSEIERLRTVASSQTGLLNRLARTVDWRLEFPFFEPVKCFHGGVFFDAIGTEFERLERRHDIINADVLDAWFPPAPEVLAAVRADLSWLLQTSPPTDCGGLLRSIARTRRVPPDCLLPAGGSSNLIFLALPHWLTPQSRVLLLDPTYGEYAHVLEHVIRCRVERFCLRREDGYELNLSRLQRRLCERPFDLLILVNPNSPTGRHVARSELQRLLERMPPKTRAWVDETYVEYAGPGESLEPFAANSSNVVVCKSMSKAYALSGARVAYLCGAPEVIAELRAMTPPWAVSLPGQLAAVRALQESGYYARRYAQTHRFRARLAEQLGRFEGWEIVPGVANFLLCHPPADGPDAAEIVRQCGKYGLFLRDAGGMGSRLGRHALRIAVKDEETNKRIVEILSKVEHRLARTVD